MWVTGRGGPCVHVPPGLSACWDVVRERGQTGTRLSVWGSHRWGDSGAHEAHTYGKESCLSSSSLIPPMVFAFQFNFYMFLTVLSPRRKDVH